MIFKRFTHGLIVLCLGSILGACSGFSGEVADHWPHWAGGEPNGLPPRPGTPGYDEYIAHKQQDSAAAQPPVTAGNANPSPAAAGGPPLGDKSAIEGGLY
jgi:hypothetical protein